MTEFEVLGDLLGAYLNEDYQFSFGSSDAALDAFVHDDPQGASRLRAEIGDLLRDHPDEASLQSTMEAMGLAYSPVRRHWPSYRAWLLAVADRVDGVLEAQLNRRRPA